MGHFLSSLGERMRMDRTAIKYVGKRQKNGMKQNTRFVVLLFYDKLTFVGYYMSSKERKRMDIRTLKCKERAG